MPMITGGTLMPGLPRAGGRQGLAAEAILTPAALSGNVNDYGPVGSAAAYYWRLDPNGASRNITGLAAGGDGDSIVLCNVGATAGQDLVLKHQSASSAAANRIIGPNQADVTIQSGECRDLWYDGAASRWRVKS